MEPTKLSGAIINSLLRRMVEPLAGDDPDSMYFCIGGKVVKYGMWESALVTGLSFKGSDVVIHPRGCAGSELINKYFIGKKNITLGELSRKFDSVEQSTDKVKLGLVLLVQEVEQIGKSKTNPKGKSAIAGHGSFKSAYNLYGFPYAFQVWAFEIIPILRESFASRLKPKQFPRVLHYACYSIRPESSAVENILTSKIEVLACIKPTEGEMSSKHMGSVLLMSVDLSESEDDDEDKAEEMEISMEMQSANQDWEVDKDDGSETQAPQSCSNQDTQLLREVFTQVKELTSKVSRMDKEMSKLKDGDNRNNQVSIEMWRTLKKRFENDKENKSLETKMKEMEYENKNLIYQNDELRKHYNEEINKMQQEHKYHLERINREHEELKSEMESQRKEREVLEMALQGAAEKK
ncbi:hypothetical protein MKW92_042963, partial [Papaver armeniacum]